MHIRCPLCQNDMVEVRSNMDDTELQIPAFKDCNVIGFINCRYFQCTKCHNLQIFTDVPLPPKK